MKQAALLCTISLLLFGISGSVLAQGTLQGTVNFRGTPPEMPVIRLSADPTCIQLHKGDPPRRQDIVVNRNATLKNVIVYVKSGLPTNKRYPIPAEPAVLDQRGCMYEPHVFAMRAGQELKILNSDNTIHNVHAQARNNRKFNASMISNKVPPLIRKFEKPELAIPIKCDVHPWMLSWAGVFDHPYFAVTGEDGTWKIDGLPPGEYTVATWHEKLGEREEKVQVSQGAAKELTFTYGAGSATPKVR